MNRKLLIITLSTAFLGIALAISINFLTNDKNISDWLVEKGIGTKELIGTVSVITVIFLILEFFKFHNQNSTEIAKDNDKSGINQNIKVTDNSQNYQVVGDITVNNPDSVKSHNQLGGQTAHNITNINHHYSVPSEIGSEKQKIALLKNAPFEENARNLTHIMEDAVIWAENTVENIKQLSSPIIIDEAIYSIKKIEENLEDNQKIINYINNTFSVIEEYNAFCGIGAAGSRQRLVEEKRLVEFFSNLITDLKVAIDENKEKITS